MHYGRNSLEPPRSAATSLTGPATIRDLMVRMLAIRWLPPADAEHVIPSTRINTGRVVTQLVGNLIHFKRRRLGLDKDSSADEDVVPQPCFEMAFHFCQIEIGA